MSSVPDDRPQRAVLRYSNAAVAFHWITVALVLTQAYLGFRFGDAEPGPARDAIFAWHKTVGVVILLVVLARLIYRSKNPPPPFPEGLKSWERHVAVWNHRLFYLLLIAMPIVGFIAVSGFAGGKPTELLGGIMVPTIPGIPKSVGEMAGELHEISAFLLIALILLHVAAALKHQFVDKWRGSGRMPPFTAHGPPVAIGQGDDRDRAED
jgi:cytochrome b561